MTFIPFFSHNIVLETHVVGEWLEMRVRGWDQGRGPGQSRVPGY